MKYFILAPANVTSGGPELAHQMCHELKNKNCDAKMYYISDNIKEPIDVPCPEKYQKYNTTHTANLFEVEQSDSVVIVPEGVTNWLEALNNCYKVLWWMSVDNYFVATNGDNLSILKNIVNLHLVQSYYAYDYLLNIVGISKDKIMFVSDYIGETFQPSPFPNDLRKNIALYNPKKGYNELSPLIERTSWLRWIPLINLTEKDMATLMQVSKIYVDFGPHPGKDRIPREAAYCGCCVITNRKGSANFFEDVPINDIYKYINPQESLDTIETLMKDICSHFDEHFNLFNNYRSIIYNERNNFISEVTNMINYIESHITDTSL